jgi:hypothetical protein
MYCSEQYFEGHVLRDIENKFNNIYIHGQKATEEIRVPIEDFTNLHQM